MATGLSRQTEALIGIGFLLVMTVLLVLAIIEFEGPTTLILLVVAGVFLLVAIFFLSGSATHRARAGDAGGGQQQSVVLGGGPEPLRVSQGGVLVVCPSCESRVPESSVHCSQCGAAL